MCCFIRGCKIYVSPLFLLWITALLIIDKTGQIGIMLLSCLCHKLGHIAVMFAVGGSPAEISFFPFSVDIKKGNADLSLFGELAIHIAGIATNFVVGFLSILSFLRWNSDSLFVFSASNISVGLFNLLPIEGLDGGNFLYQLMWGINYKNTDRLCKAVSAVTVAVLFALSVFLIIRFYNPALLLFCIYILLLGGSFLKKDKS